jgi:hypothetical protein
MQHYVIKFLSVIAAGRWFSPDTLVSSTNKTHRTTYSYRYHVINEKSCVIVVADIISGENWLVMFLFSV